MERDPGHEETYRSPAEALEGPYKPPVEAVKSFLETDFGDKEAGRVIMQAVIERSGLDVDEYTAKPLIGKDRSPKLDEEGNPLTVADYLNTIALMHPNAITKIFEFIHMDSSDPEFDTERQIMVGTIERYT